jgi:hypothetical protein
MKILPEPQNFVLDGFDFFVTGDLSTNHSVIVLGRTQPSKKSDGITKILEKLFLRGYNLIWLDAAPTSQDLFAIAHQLYENNLKQLSNFPRLKKIARRRFFKRLIKLAVLLPKKTFWTIPVFLNLMTSLFLHPFEQTQIRLTANLRAKKLEQLEKVLPNHSIIILSVSSGCRAAAIPQHQNNVKAIICFGYPFKNPLIRHPQQWRTSPLSTINKPYFIFQGDCDEYLNADQAASIHKSRYVRMNTVSGNHDYSALSEEEINRVLEAISPFTDIGSGRTQMKIFESRPL